MPKMYGALAEWWPLLSAPSDYQEEAAMFRTVILQRISLLRETSGEGRPTMLELGAGGGNNASHLKRDFRMTLVDLSAGMLAHSRRLNPECEHLLGDMRSIRLDREFHAVFIHDAICSMTSLSDLAMAMETAFAHCRPGGVALFVPDYTRESFEPETDHGGYDCADRAMRYLEWVWDPDPNDNTHVTDYVFALRSADGRLHVEQDRHVEGLFSREEWMQTLQRVGFVPERIPFQHSEVERELDLFLGVKPSA